jgi:serine/threonine-protein kinase
MADVFVSYKAEDRKRIRPLVEALQAEGFSVWWDEQIGGGSAWRQAIETELNAAKCVIVVWSNRSIGPDGTFVQDEATRAQQRHVYVPVLIDKVHLPLGFGETQALPLTGWKGDRSDPRYEAVLAAVRRLAGGEATPIAGHRPRQPLVSRRVAMGGGAAAAVAIAGVGGWALLKPSSASAARSIAVLPFANLSGDPAQAYFSDGIAEELRNALARVGGLEVVGRTSSEAVRNDDASTAAKKLGVANILTGSVRQSPSTIRISAELVDGRTGLDKWSQDYDRTPGDAIKIQTDIAENVATALSAALGGAARAAVAIGGTTNASAQDLYLKARAQYAADDSEASLRRANGLLDSAIALDPKFADAYALKASVLTDLNGFYGTSGNFGPGYVEAAAVAQRAIALAPNLASARLILAHIRMEQLNVGEAAAEFQKGHSLAGSDVDDLLSYSLFLMLVGRTDQAIDLARQAQARDPLNPGAYATEGGAQLRGRHYSEAAAAYRKALALAPNLSVAGTKLGDALFLMGRFDEAAAEYRKVAPNYLFRLIGEAVLFARQGNRSGSDAALARAQKLFGDSANYQYAEIYAQRGDRERAFAALERAWQFRDPGLAYMYSEPFMQPLRSDPRFGTFLKRMNFPNA